MAFTTPGLALVLLVQGGTSGPAVPPAPRHFTAADSERVLGAAREAQRTFEFVRRRDLDVEQPQVMHCQFNAGRFCYERDEDEDALPPPPEAATTLRARQLLVDLLRQYADSLPGDNWIIGQRVRYLVDGNEPDSAIAIARRCGGQAWWCSALAGYTYHVRSRYAQADSAYAVALTQMPPAERCKWTDISTTLSGDLAKEYVALDCVAREHFATRLDSIAAPLYMISRTDLWTEHLARETYTAFSEDAATTQGLTWHNDMRELTIRFGWPIWFTQSFPVALPETGPLVTGHDRPRPFYYFPPRAVVDHPSEAKATDWRDDDPRAPSGYAPEYARAVHELPHQIVRFKRGDTALVMAAWNGRQDGSLHGSPLQVAVVIAPDPSRESVTERAASPDNIAGTMLARGPAGGVLSIELLARRDRRAARARVGLAPLPTGDLVISDLLLFRPAGPPPQDVNAAAAMASTDETIRRDRPLGVFWEVYPAEPKAEPVKVAISVDQLDEGFLRRATDKLHLFGQRSSLRIEYDDRVEAQPYTAKAVQLDVSRLRPGAYRIQVSVTPPDGAASIAERQVTIAGPVSADPERAKPMVYPRMNPEAYLRP